MNRIERDVRVLSRSSGLPTDSSGVSAGVAFARIDSGSLIIGGRNPGSFGVRYASCSSPSPSESESDLALPSSALELD